MNCDACYEWCPMEISTGNLLQEMRVELDKRDLIPDRLHKLKENPESNGSVFEESPFKKYAGNTKFDHNDEDPEVLYYIGCMDLKYRKESVKATMALLEHLGIPYCTKLEERQCCGGPIDKVGYRSVAKPLAEQNTDLIDDSGVDTVITTCPGCLETLKITYNEDLDVKQKVDVVHAINFFNDKIKNGELKLTEKIEKDITYHDPCILSRTSSKVANADLARELFNKIPGLAIKEPYLNKNETRCCGMGGGYHVSNPDYSKEVGLDRYQQLEKLDTDYIVSGCPTCEYALLEAQEEKEGKAKDVEDGQQIIDIVELLAESAGLEY